MLHSRRPCCTCQRDRPCVDSAAARAPAAVAPAARQRHGWPKVPRQARPRVELRAGRRRGRRHGRIGKARQWRLRQRRHLGGGQRAVVDAHVIERAREARSPEVARADADRRRGARAEGHCEGANGCAVEVHGHVAAAIVGYGRVVPRAIARRRRRDCSEVPRKVQAAALNHERNVAAGRAQLNERPRVPRAIVVRARRHAHPRRKRARLVASRHLRHARRVEGQARAGSDLQRSASHAKAVRHKGETRRVKGREQRGRRWRLEGERRPVARHAQRKVG